MAYIARSHLMRRNAHARLSRSALDTGSSRRLSARGLSLNMANSMENAKEGNKKPAPTPKVDKNKTKAALKAFEFSARENKDKDGKVLGRIPKKTPTTTTSSDAAEQHTTKSNMDGGDETENTRDNVGGDLLPLNIDNSLHDDMYRRSPMDATGVVLKLITSGITTIHHVVVAVANPHPQEMDLRQDGVPDMTLLMIGIMIGIITEIPTMEIGMTKGTGDLQVGPIGTTLGMNQIMMITLRVEILLLKLKETNLVTSRS
jgi:hypothetical protein